MGLWGRILAGATGVVMIAACTGSGGLSAEAPERALPRESAPNVQPGHDGEKDGAPRASEGGKQGGSRPTDAVPKEGRDASPKVRVPGFGPYPAGTFRYKFERVDENPFEPGTLVRRDIGVETWYVEAPSATGRQRVVMDGPNNSNYDDGTVAKDSYLIQWNSDGGYLVRWDGTLPCKFAPMLKRFPRSSRLPETWKNRAECGEYDKIIEGWFEEAGDGFKLLIRNTAESRAGGEPRVAWERWDFEPGSALPRRIIDNGTEVEAGVYIRTRTN